jgi:hypothetical protein
MKSRRDEKSPPLISGCASTIAARIVAAENVEKQGEIRNADH